MINEIKRPYYLNKLIEKKNNHLIKVITGIRRCGKSYLLRTLFKNYLLENGIDENHIIEMSFDLYENIKYCESKVFFEWIIEKIKDNNYYFVLLDEVQLLNDFVPVLNSLNNKNNVDIYVTGSNAKFLSKDVVTEFGGRGDEINMFPLSFSEFMNVYNGHPYDGFKEYMTYGGIPMVVLTDKVEYKENTLDYLLKETFLNDIKKRYKIRNLTEIESLLDFLASSIGSLTNPNKLENTFKSVNNSLITATTIKKYLDALEDSFLIEETKRYDVKGKKYIGTPLKYYFSDLGLRNARINYRQDEPSHLMENIIFNELRIRGYKVDVGCFEIIEKGQKKQVEVDFIAHLGSNKIYIQSAYLLPTKEKLNQEIRPYKNIRDSFRKILVTMDPINSYYTDDGIYVINIYDFLLKPELIQ